jgi:hypothetical protein
MYGVFPWVLLYMGFSSTSTISIVMFNINGLIFHIGIPFLFIWTHENMKKYSIKKIKRFFRI